MSCRCSSCRQALPGLEQDSPSWAAVPTSGADGSGPERDLIQLTEESLPQWAQDKVEESGWTKGKLLCPSCQTRLGGFDYVGRAANRIYLVRSKVDLRVEPPTITAEPEPSSSSTWRAASPSSSESSSSSPSPSSFEEEFTPDAASSSSSDSSPLQRPPVAGPSSSHELPALALLTPRTSTYTMRSARTDRRRRFGIGKPMRRIRQGTPVSNALMDSAELRKKKILQMVNDLEELSYEVSCPVCLELLFEPFSSEPCGHIFCGPCLRRVSGRKPFSTRCPLCRTAVQYCKAKESMFDQIETDYPKITRKRRSTELSSNVYLRPLPWRPGFRALLHSRTRLGGRYYSKGARGNIRHLLVHIPYYATTAVASIVTKLLLVVIIIGVAEVFPLMLKVMTMESKESRLTAEILDSAGQCMASEYTLTAKEQFFLLMEEDYGFDMTYNFNLRHGKDNNIFPKLPSEHCGRNQFPLHSGKAIDATLYYVLVIMSMIAAVVGNFLLVHHHPVALVPGHGSLLSRLRDHFSPAPHDFRPFAQRVVDFSLLILFILFPLLLLPMVLPFIFDDERPGLIARAIIPFVLDVYIYVMDLMSTYMALSTVIILGTGFCLGSVYIDYEYDF